MGTNIGFVTTDLHPKYSRNRIGNEHRVCNRCFTYERLQKSYTRARQRVRHQGNESGGRRLQECARMGKPHKQHKHAWRVGGFLERVLGCNRFSDVVTICVSMPIHQSWL